MIINNRKNDMLVEREIAKFLDKHLYSDNTVFKQCLRTDDINQQLEGSDIIVTTINDDLNDAVVDEKVAVTQANKPLKTFALELSFIGRNKIKRCGWFIDKNKKTEYYLIGWINKADIPYNTQKGKWETDLIREDNIKELEWALVSRKKIFDFLIERGWTLERIIKQEEKIRKNKSVKTKEFINDVSFRYSDAYIEKPINILLKRETYLNLADYKGIINNT